MKQEDKNVTIVMGGGYEIAYIGNDIPPDVIAIVTAFIKAENKRILS